jgi:F-type H+-transporting ATPase subunit alpha
LRLDLASFRELEAFAQLGTDLDPATQARLDRGYRMVELLKQSQYNPLSMTDQVMLIYAGTKGYLDAVPLSEVGRWQDEFLEFMQTKKKSAWDTMNSSLDDGGALKKDDNDATKAVVEALTEFNESFK